MGIIAILLRLITPDPDRVPIYIWIVATSLIDKLLIIAIKFGEVAVNRDVIIFQKRIPNLGSLYARPRLRKKTTGEMVNTRILIIKKPRLREISAFSWRVKFIS